MLKIAIRFWKKYDVTLINNWNYNWLFKLIAFINDVACDGILWGTK